MRSSSIGETPRQGAPCDLWSAATRRRFLSFSVTAARKPKESGDKSPHSKVYHNPAQPLAEE
jgi:hypothetical protein